jgi:hypothetical protein
MREPHEPKRLEWWLIDLNEVKSRRKENLSKSIKSTHSIDCVDVTLQSPVTYTYIGSRA